MEQRTCAACGKPAGDANLCKECVKDWAKRLAWLLKAGMPALQQIAYKQATTRERSPRHGNRAYAAPPVNEAAQALYSAVETHLQLTGGMLGVKPIGHDRYDRPRTLMQWADITRLLLHHMPDLARLDTAGDLYADLIRLSEKVETATTHAGERRLVRRMPRLPEHEGGRRRADTHADLRRPLRAVCGVPRMRRMARLEARAVGVPARRGAHAHHAHAGRRRPMGAGEHGCERDGQGLGELAQPGQDAVHAAHRPALLGVEHHGAVGLCAGSRRTRRRRRLNVRRFRVMLSRVIGVSEKPVPSGMGFFRIRSPWMVGRAVEGTRLLGGQA